MKCAARWVGVISSVLLVAGQLYAQGENADKSAEAPTAKPAGAPAPGGEVSAAGMSAATAPAAAAPATVEAPAVTPVLATAANNATDNSRDALVSEIKSLEGLRRNALRDYGMTSLAAGHKALRTGDYEEALKQYSMADTYIPEIPDTRAAREEAKDGIRQALYLNAQLLWKKGDREKALQLARQAIEKGHPNAANLAADIQKEIENPPKVVPPKAMARMFETTYKDDRDIVMGHLRVARQYYIVGDYDHSRQELEIILRDHPYNTEAIEMLKKLGDRTYDISSEEFEATRSRMIRDVMNLWTPRRYGIDTVDIKEPTAAQSTSRVLLPGGTTAEQAIEAKMRRIILPEINFRNANINDVINFFEASSREYDDPTLPPEKRGVNFVLRGITATGAPAVAPTAAPATAPGTPPAATDPFAPAAADTSAASATTGPVPITFSARFVSLWDALKIVNEVSHLKSRIRGNIVVVMPINETDETMEQRSYTVTPTMLERASGVAKEMTAAPAAAAPAGNANALGAATAPLGGNVDPKVLFTQLGVTWPVGSSVTYIPSIGKLRVVNTVDNLAIFEKVLEEINVPPPQIEIEARFVEVSQSDLDSLGVDWQLGQPVTVATGTGNSSLTAYQSAGASTPYDISQGLRFLSQNPLGLPTATAISPDNLLSLRGVFDQFDVTTILHALSQRSNTDLLSAPKVVTKAGQEATIKVVTEYIYPTTFTVQQAASTSTIVGGTSSAVPPSVEPGGFQERDVGVILQVAPEVSADGQMINLAMSPQVVSEPVWKDYGYDVNIGGQITHLPMQQPFFQVRSVNTSVSIFNGSTVVMGGMITENRLSSNDKIPILGDLPYFGQFFSSKTEQTQKRNLLIFVTARLVDPAGRSVRTHTEPALRPMPATEIARP